MTRKWAPDMLNKLLSPSAKSRQSGVGGPKAMFQFVVAAFIMAVGLSVSGAATHLYQGFARQPAMLRYDGPTYAASIGHVAMSFICGPYIMLQLGWRHEPGDKLELTSALIAALVAFGWAFITGLLVMGIYFAVVP